MNSIFFFLTKHKFFSIFITLIFVIVATSLVLPQREKNDPQTQPLPTVILPNPTTLPGKFFEGQRSVIGQTTENQLKDMAGLKKEEVSIEGKTFIFTSSLISRPSSVSTDTKGKAIFERIIIPSNKPLVKMSELKSAIGEEETLINGSSFYGVAINTYIYSSRGLAVLANPYTDEIYEVQIFQPMSVSAYIKKYADTGSEKNIQEGN